MAFCTECGFQVPDTSAFCPNCGKGLTPSENSQPAYSDTPQPSEYTRPEDTAYESSVSQEYAPPVQAEDSSEKSVEASYDTGSQAGTYQASSTQYSYQNPVPPSYEAPNTYQTPETPPPYQTPSQGYQPQNTYYAPTPQAGMGYAPAPEKKSGSKAGLIIGIILGVLVLVAAYFVIQAINAPKTNVPPSGTLPTINLPTQNTPAPQLNVQGSGYVDSGDYFISIVGAEEFTDIDNQKSIRIYYYFTNLYEYPQTPYSVLEVEARQNGKLLDYAYAWNDVEEYYNEGCRIRTGVTVPCSREFKYDPNGGSVEISIYGWYDEEDGGVVNATYSPGALTGVPIPYTYALYPNPAWTLGLPSEGYLDDGDYYAAVVDAELIDDYAGDPAIRIYYEFHNYSDSPESLYYALYPIAYQDGISLFMSYAEVDSETDLNFEKEIPSGQTIRASAVYKLRNVTSNVEAEVEAGYTYDAIGHTFSLKD